MGALFSCCTGSGDVAQEGYNSMRLGSGSGGATAVVTPDPEERRRQLAEAAEKRLQAQEHKGIKNPESVRRQQQRKEEMERKEEELARMGNKEPGLRWQVS